MSLFEKAASSHLRGLIFAKARAKIGSFATCYSTLIHICILLLFSLFTSWVFEVAFFGNICQFLSYGIDSYLFTIIFQKLFVFI